MDFSNGVEVVNIMIEEWFEESETVGTDRRTDLDLSPVSRAIPVTVGDLDLLSCNTCTYLYIT